MSSKRLHSILTILLVLLGIGMVAGAYGANSLFEKHAKALTDQKTLNASLLTQQSQLAKDKQDVTQYKDLDAIARAIVPQDKDQAQAVLEIVKLASQSNIPRLTSVTFPTSTLGTKAPASKPHGTTNKSGLTQLTPVPDIPGVYNLQITVQQSPNAPVPYATFLSFLDRLEQNRRTAQVSTVTVTPDPKNASLVSFTLVIDEYIKP